MKIYEGYILVAEITKKADKSDAWLHSADYSIIEYILGIPVVKVSSLLDEYKKLANQCQDLKYYYPYAAFSIEIGRSRDFMAGLHFNREKNNKPQFDSLKIGAYRLIKLSDEFIELVQKGLNPYKLRQNCNTDDYKVIIEMQDMKIGFY